MLKPLPAQHLFLPGAAVGRIFDLAREGEQDALGLTGRSRPSSPRCAARTRPGRTPRTCREFAAAPCGTSLVDGHEANRAAAGAAEAAEAVVAALGQIHPSHFTIGHPDDGKVEGTGCAALYCLVHGREKQAGGLGCSPEPPEHIS